MRRNVLYISAALCTQAQVTDQITSADAFTPISDSTMIFQNWATNDFSPVYDPSTCVHLDSPINFIRYMIVNWASSVPIEEILLIVPDSVQGMASMDLSYKYTESIGVKTNVNQSLTTDDVQGCDLNTPQSGDFSVRMSCKMLTDSLVITRRPTGSSNDGFRFCSMRIYSEPRQTDYTTMWGTALTGIGQDSSLLTFNTVSIAQLKTTTVFDEYSFRSGVNPYFKIELTAVGDHPLFIITLDAVKTVNIVSIVCVSAQDECTGMEVQVMSTPPHFDQLKSRVIPGTVAGSCDQMTTAAGQDITCTGAVGKYIALSRLTVMNIKNIAVYAGYDCQKVQWKLLDEQGNDASRTCFEVPSGGAMFAVRAVVDSTLTTHANDLTLTRECSKQLGDQFQINPYASVYLEYVSGEGSSPTTFVPNYEILVHSAATIPDGAEGLHIDIFSANFQSMPYYIDKLTVNVVFQFNDPNGTPYADKWATSLNFATTGQTCPQSWCLAASITDDPAWTTNSLVSTPFQLSMFQSADLVSPRTQDSPASELTFNPFDLSAVSDCTFTYEVAVYDMAGNEIDMTGQFAVIPNDPLQPTIFTLQSSYSVPEENMSQRYIKLKAVDQDGDSFEQAGASYFVLMCHADQTLEIQEATGNTVFEAVKGFDLTLSFVTGQPSCWDHLVSYSSDAVSLMTQDWSAQTLVINLDTSLNSDPIVLTISASYNTNIVTLPIQILPTTCVDYLTEMGTNDLFSMNPEIDQDTKIRTVNAYMDDLVTRKNDDYYDFIIGSFRLDVGLTIPTDQCQFEYSLADIDEVPLELVSVNDAFDINFPLQDPGSNELDSSYAGKQQQVSLVISDQDGNTKVPVDFTYTLQFYCHRDLQNFQMTPASSSYQLIEGQSLVVPITMTFLPDDPNCWQLEATISQSSSTATESLSLVMPDQVTESFILLIDPVSASHTGIHEVELTLTDVVLPLVTQSVTIQVTVDLMPDGSFELPDECDPSSLTLNEVESTTDPLDSVTLSIGQDLTVALPTFNVESHLEGGSDIGDLCGPLAYELSLSGQDPASGEAQKPSFAIVFAEHGEVYLQAFDVSQIGEYDLELSVWLQELPSVSETVSFLSVTIEEGDVNETTQTKDQSGDDQADLQTSEESQDTGDASSDQAESEQTRDVDPGDRQNDHEYRFSPSYVLDSPELSIDLTTSLPIRHFAAVRVDEISQVGLLTLKFNETVAIQPQEFYRNVSIQDFDVTYVQNSDETPQEMAYELLEVTESQVTVQLIFDEPILVSQGLEPDQLVIKLNKDLFLLPTRFNSTNSLANPEAEPYHILRGNLPKQLDSIETLETLQLLGSSSNQAVVGIIIASLIAGIALKGVLSRLWAMLNTLQLINALSIIQISIPSNVFTVQKESQKVINFQPLPKDLIFEAIFGADETYEESESISAVTEGRRLASQGEEQLSTQETLDMVSTGISVSSASEVLTSFELSGESLKETFFVLGLTLALALLLIGCVKLYRRLCIRKSPALVRKLCLKLRNMLMFNSLLRYWLMTFFTTSIGCAIQISLTRDDPSAWRMFESSLSVLILLLFLVATFKLSRFLLRNKSKLRDSNFKQSYGTLYTACDTYKGNYALLYVAVFCMRRFLVAMIIGFAPTRPLLQITVTVVLSHCVMLYHLRVWPMESKLQNLLYLLNEYVYLACTFSVLGFSGYSTQPQDRYSLGWVYMGFLGLIVMANIVVMLINIIGGLIKRCKAKKGGKKITSETPAQLTLAQQNASLNSKKAQRKTIATELGVIKEASKSHVEVSSASSDQLSPRQHTLNKGFDPQGRPIVIDDFLIDTQLLKPAIKSAKSSSIVSSFNSSSQSYLESSVSSSSINESQSSSQSHSASDYTSQSSVRSPGESVRSNQVCPQMADQAEGMQATADIQTYSVESQQLNTRVVPQKKVTGINKPTPLVLKEVHFPRFSAQQRQRPPRIQVNATLKSQAMQNANKTEGLPETQASTALLAKKQLKPHVDRVNVIPVERNEFMVQVSALEQIEQEIQALGILKEEIPQRSSKRQKHRFLVADKRKQIIQN